MKRLLVLVTILGLVALSVRAQESQLGRVEFPTSGSKEAQGHFLRGLAALHSFWYEEALKAFREATKVDPDFAMGYWGEAMTYNHPLWSEQDLATARQVLAKLKETPRLTDRERAYIAAVRVLYGEGDKRARDAAYSAAMKKVYLAYPEDLDAAAFYSLSLLGMTGGGAKGYRFAGQSGRDCTRGIPEKSKPSGRRALHHSCVRRSRSRDSCASRRTSLREHRAGSTSRASHAVAHISPARNVAGNGGVE